MNILSEVNFTCRVSSVLNKEVKQYGKQFMFDKKEDTSWSSDEGNPQWITVSLDEPQNISGFSLQFQGGFAGLKSRVIFYSTDGVQLHEEPFYPEDINSSQVFQVKDTARQKASSKIKLVFESSTDLFGRIIVYNLQLFS
ncbi:nuclear receptor 2C2-associated protein [Drosophila ficusphila]|uniref:nuclear receptor 2C2-associated protein n=1 Tax=Drosophila ficusphila TaxID=30025 RepID=UPI0007E72E31|nr:nuclear receptor 2C2-associated protein [Drosophila ficusphila]